MNPWEETWEADDDRVWDPQEQVTVAYGPMTDETARFIAAAPEMARLLMHICRTYPGTDGACMVCDAYSTQPHTRECSIGKVLRKAGIAC